MKTCFICGNDRPCNNCHKNYQSRDRKQAIGKYNVICQVHPSSIDPAIVPDRTKWNDLSELEKHLLLELQLANEMIATLANMIVV